MSDVRDERIIRVGIRKHRANRKEHCQTISAPRCTRYVKHLTLRYRQRRGPLVPQDIKTDGTVCVDIGVINLGREADLGRLEGVIDWERDGEEEDTASIRRLPLVAARVNPERHGSKQLELTGPIMVACHWNMLSPVGPALQEDGGSRPRSINS